MGVKMKKDFISALSSGRLFFDGGYGTELSAYLSASEAPEALNSRAPERVRDLHLSYLRAGANIVKTNTFGINAAKYADYKERIAEAVAIAVEAVSIHGSGFVALDIGPSGRMMEPLGDLSFEDAVELFGKNIRAAEGLPVDLILIETMNDSYETKAAVLAAKENSDLPIVVTNVYDEREKLLTGASPEAMAAMLEGLSVTAIGANCSLGPEGLVGVARRLLSATSLPVVMNPNAGLPAVEGGVTKYTTTPGDFAEAMKQMAEMGVAILGGCCGTTPEYIAALCGAVESVPVAVHKAEPVCAVSSYTHAVRFGDTPLLIGERINPTGKKKLKEALRAGDLGYILREAISEEEAGAHLLDVNVGLPEIDEAQVMEDAIRAIQSVTDLPLQIDTGDPVAMERAMRIYNGKPLVNSVNGNAESMRAVFPLVKKYGGVCIALTMDEQGIPADCEGRLAIAERILEAAAEYGLGKEDIVFDPLALTVSSDPNAANVTLKTVAELAARGCYTSLGVSNVSFGMPERDKLNATFFTMALSAGLSAAIMNPHSAEMMSAYRAYLALSGKGDGIGGYISYAQGVVKAEPAAAVTEQTLAGAICAGLKEDAARIAVSTLLTREPLDIVNGEIIPALTAVGADFEAGRVFLPGLLMSAEAARAALDLVKERMPVEVDDGRAPVVMATVKGDIHDIGKNIVKAILESHGFPVLDLGRDVPAERIVEEARRTGAVLVGLSALMTTTVPAMEQTVRLLAEQLPECRVMVGGAVLNEEYAEMIGAHYYAPDAMAAVRIAKLVCEK